MSQEIRIPLGEYNVYRKGTELVVVSRYPDRKEFEFKFVSNAVGKVKKKLKMKKK